MSVEKCSPEKHVCHNCIGDQFLADLVKVKGAQALCSYCGVKREALTLKNLAECIRKALLEHFRLTPGNPIEPYEYFLVSQGAWARSGEQVDIVIAEMAGLSEEVAEEIQGLLSERYGYRAVKEGDENPYEIEAQYEERQANERPFRYTWQEFRTEIQSHARFFSKHAEEMLNNIFGDLTGLKVYDGSPIIRAIGPADEDRFIWRARIAQSTEDLKDILMAPDRELGPPPSSSATGGRMSAQGIPVFYGAFDEATCVAEVRPPVGSHVVVAKFELLHYVQLLDLDALAEVLAEGSYFDPAFTEHTNRMAFLRQMVREISQPVMPQDEASEYLITQVVAEYLANRATPNFDGIIFNSSQTGGKGRNLVLFNHACGVERYDLPEGTTVTVDSYADHQDDDKDENYEIIVMETVPPVSSDDKNPASITAKLQSVLRGSRRESVSPSKPTLRLDVNSIGVLDIKAVSYDHEARSLSRHRQTSEDADRWAEAFE